MGETARNASLNATIFERKITIRQASIADFAGVGASLAGNLDASSTEPKSVSTTILPFVIQNASCASWVRNFRYRASKWARFRAKAVFDATLSKADMKLSANAAGAQIKIDGSVENYFVNPRLNLWSAVTHPELKTALREFAPEYRPAAESLVRFRCAHICAAHRTISPSKRSTQSSARSPSQVKRALVKHKRPLKR